MKLIVEKGAGRADRGSDPCTGCAAGCQMLSLAPRRIRWSGWTGTDVLAGRVPGQNDLLPAAMLLFGVPLVMLVAAAGLLEYLQLTAMPVLSLLLLMTLMGMMILPQRLLARRFVMRLAAGKVNKAADTVNPVRDTETRAPPESAKVSRKHH